MGKASIRFEFNQQRVLITGGTSGMGEATAIAFTEAGANVVITGRNQQRADKVIAQCDNAPGSVVFIAGDITNRAQCDGIVSGADDILGGLDIVVNSAGVIYHATAEQTSDEQWLHTMSVNVNGMFYIYRAAIPHLRMSKGTIINIASDAS